MFIPATECEVGKVSFRPKVRRPFNILLRPEADVSVVAADAVVTVVVVVVVEGLASTQTKQSRNCTKP